MISELNFCKVYLKDNLVSFSNRKDDNLKIGIYPEAMMHTLDAHARARSKIGAQRSR